MKNEKKMAFIGLLSKEMNFHLHNPRTLPNPRIFLGIKSNIF
jgi:hypothetical protein